MNMCLGALLGTGVFTALAAPVQASNMDYVSSGLSANQYLQIMIASLILVAVFIVIAYFIGKRNARRTKVNQVTKSLGFILAILYLIVGTFLLIIDFIVLIEPYVQIDAFIYTVQTFRYYFPEMVFGIIIVGAAGLLLYLVGLYILVFVRDTELVEKEKGAYHIQASPELDSEVSKGQVEYSRLKFRVTFWDTKEPLSDGKIHLETKEGTLMMIKYTDIMGEVDFGKLRGTEDDYYAYVEGDRERQEYRIVSLT
ncbi:hypothetical protein [Methanogenium organophilum]|uniref:Uncharacterized protein n=1 Tax=Methanogenium organophilum TaxID=2199 RepID=A0A9X9T934_METOG|nr:hypothetical protein [Methanogenium organophilum]WAI02021.1 hypothetical protein OU421_03890 [Methanogenium organophilum]